MGGPSSFHKMLLFIRPGRLLHLFIVWWDFKPPGWPVVEHINTLQTSSCGRWLKMPLCKIALHFPFIQASNIFCSFSFLFPVAWSVPTAQPSRSQQQWWSEACLAFGINKGFVAGLQSEWASPAKMKWSLAAGLWPPVPKDVEAASRGLNQQNVSLFILSSVCRMVALYAALRGAQKGGKGRKACAEQYIVYTS